MSASAGLTLAAIHLLVWSSKRTAWAHLLFSLTAAGTAAFAACELWGMRVETPAELGVAMRWARVPGWVLTVSLVWFVRLYLRAGRLWLAWTVCGLRTLWLVLHFILTPNLNYRHITAVRRIPFLGESVSIPEAVPNPWMLIGQLSLLLLTIFVADATLTVWRRGDRRQALVVGGSILLFSVGGAGQAVLVLWGILHLPIMSSLFYLGLVAVMGYEMSRDVLRAARLSDELHESQQGMRLAAAAAQLVLWTWDVQSNRVWVTPEGRSLYGIAPGETITLERFLASVQAEDLPSVREAVQRALRGDGEYQAEYRVVRPHGAARWIAARGKVESDRHGRPMRVRGVSLDVTERRLAETQAQRQRAELAHAGRMSTMGQLASALAHELNQPLGAILRNAEAAELFLRGNPPDLEEVRAILADIRKDDHRAGEVIDRMRALLKRRGLERTTVHIATLVDEVVPLIQPDAASRRVRLEVEVPRDLPAVRGDRVHLQQVLLNLMLNGMDAMSEIPAAARRLAVRARQADAGTIEVAVADAGHGVPADRLAHLAEPFVTTKPNGMGLGLPISFTIIEAHGGRLWAENSPSGATFFFTVPVSDEGQ